MSGAPLMEFIYVLRPTRAGMVTACPTDRERAAVGEHIAYLQGLHARGVVRRAGRTMAADERVFGIVIFTAASPEAAEAFMRADPAVRDGVMTAEVFRFRVALPTGQP